MAEAGAGSATGSTNVKRRAVDPVTARGVTMPANRTANPTTPIAVTDRTAWVEHRVAIVMKTAPMAHRPQYDRIRDGNGPAKSTNHRSATEPNTAKRDVWGSPTPNWAMAKTAGTSTAARTDRLVARRPGSRPAHQMRSERCAPGGDPPGVGTDGSVSTGRRYQGTRADRAPMLPGGSAASAWRPMSSACLLYTSDAADDLLCVDLGGRRIIKKKK